MGLLQTKPVSHASRASTLKRVKNLRSKFSGILNPTNQPQTSKPCTGSHPSCPSLNLQAPLSDSQNTLATCVGTTPTTRSPSGTCTLNPSLDLDAATDCLEGARDVDLGVDLNVDVAVLLQERAMLAEQVADLSQETGRLEVS